MGSSSCGGQPDAENTAVRGLKGVLDGSSVSSSNNGGGCTTQCLNEIQRQDGELQRRVEQLARDKVREGAFFFLFCVFGGPDVLLLVC